MDRSKVKKFSLIWGGGVEGFSATKSKLTKNHLKWIDPKSKNFPLILGGRGFSVTKTKLAQNSLKWINPKSKFFPSSWGVGTFLPTCYQYDIQWCMKYQSMKLRYVLQHEPSISPKGRKEGGSFSATKTKVTQNCLKWIDPKSKNFPSSCGGAFLPQKPNLLKIAGNG